MRVFSIRHHHDIERYREEDRQARGELSVSEVRVAATQVCANAPWILLKQDVELLQTAVGEAKSPQTLDQNQPALKIQ